MDFTLYDPVLVKICLEPISPRWHAIVSPDIKLFMDPESRWEKKNKQ